MKHETTVSHCFKYFFFFSLIPQRIPLAFTIHQPNYLTSTVTAVRFSG